MTAVSTVAQVNAAILAGNFTNEQLNAIGDAIRFARAQIANKNVFTLRAGAKVKFTGRQGAVVLGTVEKVNRKFVLVRENKPGALVGGVWRVPANMLESV